MCVEFGVSSTPVGEWETESCTETMKTGSSVFVKVKPLKRSGRVANRVMARMRARIVWVRQFARPTNRKAFLFLFYMKAFRWISFRGLFTKVDDISLLSILE